MSTSARRLRALALYAVASACAGPTASEPTDGAASDLGAEVAAPDDTPCGDAESTSNLDWKTTIDADCTHFLGSVHVPDPVASDALAPLGSLRRIDGRLSIFRPHVALDLRPLDGLEAIGGDLLWRFDDVHADLDGLRALREVGGLRVENNHALTSLSGLSRLEVVHGDATFRFNPALPRATVDALLARVTVHGEILRDD